MLFMKITRHGQRRRRCKISSTSSPPTPTLRYRKRSSITWLLLRGRFFLMYSGSPTNTTVDFLLTEQSTPSSLPQQTSYEDSISHYISTISNCINSDLLAFHLADKLLGDKIDSLSNNTTENEPIYHTSNPFEHLLTSLSDELNDEIHGFNMLDLLLTEAISDLNTNKNDTDTDCPDHTPFSHYTHDNTLLNSFTDKSEPSIPQSTQIPSPPSMSSTPIPSPHQCHHHSTYEMEWIMEWIMTTSVIAPGPSQIHTPPRCHIKAKIPMAV